MLRKYLDIFIIIYIDNILIYSENESDYIKHVQIVLETLDKAHLYIKLKKCQFNVKRLEFLGHILIIDRIEMALSKVKYIKN